MEELEGDKGESYKIKNRSNTAYTIVNDDLPLLSGTYESNANVNIQYQERVEVVVNFLDQSNSKPIRSGKVIKSYTTDTVKVVAEDVEGYRLVGEHDISLVVSPSNKSVTFYYIKESPVVPEVFTVTIDPKNVSLVPTQSVTFKTILSDTSVIPDGIEYRIVDCNQCVNLAGDTLTAISTGGAIIETKVTVGSQEFTDTASVIVTNMEDETE